MGKMYASYEAMLSLYAEMVLDEAIRKRKEELLYRMIDEALESRDEELFLALTAELRSVLKTYEAVS